MRISRKEAAAMGLDVPSKQQKKKRRPTDDGVPKGDNKLFIAACLAHGLPEPICEYQFHPERKWRFDYLFDSWLALEVDGGSWTLGRHTRGEGFARDQEKGNEAIIMGFSVLHCTPRDVEDGSIFQTIRRALEGGPA